MCQSVSQSQIYFETDGRSVSQSQSYFVTESQSVVLALSPSGTHGQTLAVVKTLAVLFVVGRPPCREDVSQSLSVLAIYMYFFNVLLLSFLSFFIFI
jgi:hypothetical protein